MKIFEIKVQVYLLKDVENLEALREVTKVIDKCIVSSSNFLEFHSENQFKGYCYNNLFPLERDRIYKKGNIYTFIIRTVHYKLANFLEDTIHDVITPKFKCLVSEMREIRQKKIKKLYTITPAILKTEEGYWKGILTQEEYETRLRENAIKKYNLLNNTKIDENFKLYNKLTFSNRTPLKMQFKNFATILGDKIELEIAEDKLSQEIAFMLIGTGVLEANSRGAGFVNFK